MKFVLALTIAAYSLVFWNGFKHKNASSSEPTAKPQPGLISEIVGVTRSSNRQEIGAHSAGLGDFLSMPSVNSPANEKEVRLRGEQTKGWLDSKISENRRIVHVN
jgi:hypothetical protein